MFQAGDFQQPRLNLVPSFYLKHFCPLKNLFTIPLTPVYNFAPGDWDPVHTGDTGGPLFCKDNGLWVLQGITSFRNEPCIPSKPCVFTGVNAFIE